MANESTTREPFTLPLTPLERSVLRDRVARGRGVHLLRPYKGDLDFHQEVEDALEVFNAMQPRMVERLNREVNA